MPFQHPSLFYRDLPLRYVRDPRLGHRLGRNYPDGVHVDETWGYKWLGTNANGFYGQESAIEWGPPKPNTRRILLMGGSAAMGLGASRRGQTIRDHLQVRLNEITQVPVEVLNCAVGDYSTSQSLIYYVTELVELEPHIVIALDGWNDFAHSFWGTKYSSGEWLPNTTRSFDDNLEATLIRDGSLTEEVQRELRRRRSPRAISREQRRQRGAGDVRAFARSSHGFVWDNPREWRVKTAAVNWYLRNIRSLAMLTAGRNACLLQVLQPSMLWPRENTSGVLERDVRAFFETRMPTVAPHAESYHQSLFEHLGKLEDDLANREFRASPQNVAVRDGSQWLLDRAENLYFDPVHFNDLGQLRIAQRLATEIVDAGWLA
jgi:hypothetical protein